MCARMCVCEREFLGTYIEVILGLNSVDLIGFQILRAFKEYPIFFPLGLESSSLNYSIKFSGWTIISGWKS